MKSQIKVTRLNSCQNKTTKSTITSFLVENFPAVVQAELMTHGLLSINSESSRARPADSVRDQVRNKPYIPDWTKNQKGMSGERFPDDAQVKLDRMIFGSIKNALDNSENLDNLSVHKQDVNKISLSPYATNSLIITATQWDNFINLRTAKEAHPVMQSLAGQIKELLKLPPDNKYDAQGFYSPYPELTHIEAIAKVASVSYANHQKERKYADAVKMVNKLAEAKHASPFCMIARPVEAGEIFRYLTLGGEVKKYIVFDNFEKEESCLAYSLHYSKHLTTGVDLAKLIDTDNFSGWVSMRRLEQL